MRILILLSLVISLSACSSSGEKSNIESTTFSHAMNDGEYRRTIEKYTKSDEMLDGFSVAYKLQVTLLNSEVTDAQLWRKAEDFKWGRDQLQIERDKISQSLSEKTKVFLSFFTPVSENDNLNTGKSIWKIYLVSEGVRYEGNVNKELGTFVELERLYPHHTRFQTSYMVTFKVPTAQIQASESQFIITGPMGTSTLTFPAVR